MYVLFMLLFSAVDKSLFEIRKGSFNFCGDHSEHYI